MTFTQHEVLMIANSIAKLMLTHSNSRRVVIDFKASEMAAAPSWPIEFRPRL